MTTRADDERVASPAVSASASEADTSAAALAAADAVPADAGEQAGAAAGEPDAKTPTRPRRPVLRWSALVWLGAFGVLLANHPGRMVFDTKLGIDLNPQAYYASLWHLWDPLNTLGALNNQAAGYAVPMAPFYLAGQLAHVPVWLTERLWLSLIIAVGFAGLVKLAGALGIGSPASRYLAGLVFALWPTFTIVIGSTSAAVLPGMLAPWAVLPLVRAVRWGGVVGPAARSGAVVLFMGGVNATSTLDALLLPGLFILTQARGRRLAGLAVCWGAWVAATTAWWAVPLLLQGKYAFNFLPYVEQASTTTRTASAATTLRGAGNWTAYFNLGTPWLPAGWLMVSTPIAIIAGAVAAAGGLYGLAMRNMPAAAWLRLSAGIAAAGALAGYAGTLGGPFHRTVDDLLNGAFAPFRNVYKLEPVIAAALALGLAHAAAGWLVHGQPVTPARQAFTMAARVVTGIVLIGLTLPYVSGRILNPGSFSAVPRYWSQAAAFLAGQSPRNPALVVPADSHGNYLWGDPIDDPLEALATSPWAQRGLVPYGGAGSQILLDTAEKAIESGEQVPGLAGYLQRAGIRYVVVRNDLDPRQLGYTSAPLVHQTLLLSGFSRAASFGPLVAGVQPGSDPASPQAGLPRYPAVEVYAADAGAPPSPVSTLPAGRTVLVNGGPDSLLQLTGQHLLGSGQPAIIAGDPLPTRPAQWAVTDGQRRADTLFGLVNSNVSYTYTADETNPAGDQFGGAGAPPRQLLPVPAAGHQTVAVLSGAASVTVSSYGSWLADTQQEDPASAFDGNPATAWAEGSALTPAGQWIQITFAGQVNLPASVGIRLLDDSPLREIASQIRVSTAAGSITTTMAATGATQPLRVVPGRTGWMRITITGAGRVSPGKPGAGISDVLIPGVRVTRLLQPAEDPAGRQAASAVFSFHQQVPTPFTFADPAAVPPLARTFTVASAQTLRLAASALALPGRGLDALLDKISPPGRGVLQVSAASTPGALPAQFPVSLVAGSGGAPWIADTADPVIHLSWHGKRRIGSLIVQPAASGASTPEAVKITSPDGTRQADIGFGGLVTFKRPLVTDRIDVSFPRVQRATLVNAAGQLTTLPLGLSRLSVPALAKLRVVAPDEQARFTLACGRGPTLTVDGQAYPTSVSGTIGELSQFSPLQVRLCAPGGALTLGAGRHTLTAPAPGTFAVTDLSLASASPAATGSARAVTIHSWQPDRRRLGVGPGAASYLEVHENFNPGWTATLNGKKLTAIRLDGWQQGFVLPAGPGGTVTLSFQPAASYHLALIVSVFAILLLLAIILADKPAGLSWPDGSPPVSGGAAPPASSAKGALPPASSADGGLPPPGPPGPSAISAPVRAWRTWLGLLAVTALLLVIGGPVALAVPVLAYLGWLLPRRPGWAPLAALAFAAMAASGLLAAAQPSGAGLLGTFGGPAQACALVALAAALIPAAPVRRRPTVRGFCVVDELSCYFDSPAEPNNVHLEVWLPGRLDGTRLSEAVAALLAGQPAARVRRAAGRRWQRGYAWEVPPQPDSDPVSVMNWRTGAELDAARARFLADAPPLDHSPPFRLLRARGPEGEGLILNAHHAAFDGHSCLLLVSTIADLYSGRGMTPGPDSEVPALPAARRTRGRVALRPATRIAPHGADDSAPGYGFCLLEWPGVPAVPQRAGEPRATVNDLLVAALAETISRWNAARQEEHPGRCIRISVPADARPSGGHDALGNLSRLCTVTAEPAASDRADLVAAVAAQTRQAKDQPGPQVSPALTAVAKLPLPVTAKRRLVRLAVRGLGRLAADTSLLTNLGNVTSPPRFGSLTPVHMWFSTSAHMPRGLSVGAITVDGRLQLCFRYRRALLDDAAAGDFAAEYAEVLGRLAAQEAGR
jgi:arabinofuranan 3-O-arabinosyltransferase